MHHKHSRPRSTTRPREGTMIDKRKKPTRGLIGGGNAKKGRTATEGAAARRARGRRRTYPLPGATLNARARTILIFILISAAFCALSGLVGPWSRNAFAADGYTHTFPNGNTVEVHPDGTITGTCVMSGNAVVGGQIQRKGHHAGRRDVPRTLLRSGHRGAESQPVPGSLRRLISF